MITKYTQYIKENINNQFFTTYEETKDWLDEMYIYKYTINPDLTVDVNHFVDIGKENLTHIPVKFGKVKGYFNCNENNLSSLGGSPKYVGDIFCCDHNKLTNLIGLPEKIDGMFNCYYNKLISLDGLSYYNFIRNYKSEWFTDLNPKIKEDWFNKHLEDNSDLLNLINFPVSDVFKEKWGHLFNANKFDLI
jgi:hypothetical protein